VFAAQYVGIREVADRVWLVSFMHDDPGFFDQDENRVEPVGQNPSAPEVLPMSPVQSVTDVIGKHSRLR
jgi:putative transposase